MVKVTARVRAAILPFIVFVALQPAHAVDLTKLPQLKPGDISIANDLAQKFVFYATPEGCSKQEVTVEPKASVAVRCPGATKVSVFFIVVDAAGKTHERNQVLEASNHYTIGWDDELKAYVKLIRLFDDQGRMTR
jgi:hypothetical protein